MRPKFLVYCLAAICLVFGWKGLNLTKDIESTLQENARQAESSIMEIGMCFDWYGVIIVDSVVKTCNGVISTDEMIETLQEERAAKNEYLAGYKKDITVDEIPYADFVFSQDEKIKIYVDRLIKWAKEDDLKSIRSSIPIMYEMTDPTIEAINNIMDTKMYYNEKQSGLLYIKIENFMNFMILAVVLSIVMSICASFSKRCH